MKLSNSNLPNEITFYLKDSILWRFYSNDIESENPAAISIIIGFYSEYINTEISSSGARIFSKQDIRSALDELSEEKYLEKIDDAFADPYYFLNVKGSDRVRSQIGNINSIIGKCSNLGEPWLASAFRNAATTSDSIADTQGDAADLESDSWAPLNVDRSSPEYESAVQAVDDALTAIAGDNGYAASHPDERDHVVWSLREGLTALREKLPSASQIKSMILEPLQTAINRLKDSATGLLAFAAKEAVKEFIKSLFN